MANYTITVDVPTTTTYLAPCMHCWRFMSGSKPLPRYHPACAELLETRRLVAGMHAMVNGD